MSIEIEYGKLTKRIVFTENDHRHAQLILKLKHDGMKQSQFFRSLVTAYIDDFGFTDGEIENIFDLIEEEYPEL